MPGLFFSPSYSCRPTANLILFFFAYIICINVLKSLQYKAIFANFALDFLYNMAVKTRI